MKKVYSKTSSKKLAAYSAMAGTIVLAGAGSAVGQVVYTDIDPDETYGSNGDVFELDFNDDGVVDITLEKVFSAFSTSFNTSGGGTFPGSIQYNHLFQVPATGNAAQGSYGPYGYAYAYALDAGDNIGAGEEFVGSGSMVYSLAYNVDLGGGSYASGNFFSDGNWFGGQTDKYLGVRFEAAGNEHYGWLRMDVADDNVEFTVKGYAFNATPEEDIAAGDVGGVAINTIDPSLINAYSYGNTIHINVNGLNAQNANIRVTNTLGEVVYNNALNMGGMTISLANAAEGIYMINIIADGAVYNKQVFINQ